MKHLGPDPNCFFVALVNNIFMPINALKSSYHGDNSGNCGQNLFSKVGLNFGVIYVQNVLYKDVTCAVLY